MKQDVLVTKISSETMENIRTAGSKAGRAMKNRDMATVKSWQEYFSKICDVLNTSDLVIARLEYMESYRRESI